MGYLRDSNHKLSADEKNGFAMQHIEHDLIFPKQVEFTLTGISNTEIVEVILFYKISQTGTWQYAYSKISGTGKIKATTVIATSGNSYIPSGVTIEYYFQVKDINGDSFKTQTFTFDYLNPKHKWSKTTKGPLSIYSHGIPLEMFKEAGYIRRSDYDDLVVPNHFEPFHQKNIDLNFGYKCPGR